MEYPPPPRTAVSLDNVSLARKTDENCDKNPYTHGIYVC